MPPMGGNFSPTDVMMGRSGGGPYLWGGPGKQPGSVGPVSAGGPFSSGGTSRPPNSSGPVSAGQFSQPATPAPSGNILAPESIRATGTGPFDAQYRQNLATYAGGQFSRPGGSMSFNPTDPNTFPGQPTGGGSAPVTGMPNSLLDTALSGQGFSWTPPAQPAQSGQNPNPTWLNLQQWMQQFLQSGSKNRMGAFA